MLNKRIPILMIISVLVLSGCSSIAIRTAVVIDAPRDKVFDVLADFDAYAEWNPYHRSVVGEFREGAELQVQIQRPDGKQVSLPPHVIRIQHNEELTWGGGIKGIFYGEHRFLLQDAAGGGTLLKHDEDFSGVAVGFADLPPDVIALGYQQMNLALKHKVETQQ